MHRGETHRWRGWVVTVAAFAAAGVTALGTQAANAGVPTSPAPQSSAAQTQAEGKWSGEAAVGRLGTRLPEVARANGLSEAALRNHFLSDATLKVDATDRLLYIEPPLAVGTLAAVAPRASVFDATVDPANALLLHSKPGSNRVIYLDFDGLTITGTAWNNSTGGDCYADPYDSDGIPGSFSTSERNSIISVWRRVSEDYAAFDVDVTTEDPGYAAINRASTSDSQFGTRLIVTNSKTLCPNGKTLYASVCSGGCGGIAYVGVFDNTGTNHDYYQPAIVFQNGVTSNAKYVAEAASHEVGHNVGLSHDGTSTTGYYQGQGDWAPIMGVGYYEAITQWSKGEYADANNKQDDFAVMQANMLPLRTDDYGDTAATGFVLSGTSPSVDGVISSASDVDAFVVAAQAGPATFTVTPAPVSPDADLSITVLDSSGNVLGTNDPASGSTSYDVSTGMGASLSLSLSTGTYTVLVRGVGNGDPLTTGYSSYGSVGNYRLSASVVGTSGQAPTAVATASVTSGTAPVAVSFTGSTSSDPEGDALTYAWSFGDGGTSALADPTYTYSTAGTYTATLTVTDAQGLAGSASVVITVSAPLRRIDVSTMTISGSRNTSTSRANVTSTATIKDSSNAVVSGATVTGKWYLNSVLYGTSTVKSSTSGVASFSLSNIKIAKGTVVKVCVSSLTLTGATWDTTVFAPTTATDCMSWTAP